MKRKPLEVGAHLYRPCCGYVVHKEVIAIHSTWRGRFYKVRYDSGVVDDWVRIDRDIWLTSPVEAWKRVLTGAQSSIEWSQHCLKEALKDAAAAKRNLKKAEKLEASGRPMKATKNPYRLE